ncbi:alpha/beta hydrolase [Jatrophihabitans cynanchi]|uniref:Alpha/beta hydrolase n=1 Tax=Jatrophihabitans cynanchi TaxID=2944128 RepID=A0ABY7K2M8_9ACTN|nr:alpha/beta hydrolase [Jatrophihabitans sp. SB3-54]WAX58445.1 alpha/beta hydrolase [Jatrophihabitans sp. SB3-54]
MDEQLRTLVAAGAGDPTGAGQSRTADVQIEDVDIDGVTVYVVTPRGLNADDRRVYMDIHGGAWMMAGGDICRAVAVGTAMTVGAQVWAVDYRMPPDHPYPAPLTDCLKVYRAILEVRSPQDIIIGGVSAGANLAAALALRARDEGLALPAGAVLSTPSTDLTGAGDTWRTNEGIDTVLVGDALTAVAVYAGGHDLCNPYLSPLFADFTQGFPSTLLISGTRDRLLSDTVRLHRALRAAGIPADLHVFEAQGHGGFLGTAPEDRERAGQIRSFVDRQWGHESP